MKTCSHIKPGKVMKTNSDRKSRVECQSWLIVEIGLLLATFTKLAPKCNSLHSLGSCQLDQKGLDSSRPLYTITQVCTLERLLQSPPSSDLDQLEHYHYLVVNTKQNDKNFDTKKKRIKSIPR